jgi:hypothetical protein
VLAMSDEKAKDKGEHLTLPDKDKPALANPEGHKFRNASGGQVEAKKASNPDRSDGSATPTNRSGLYAQALIAGQDKSIELFEDDELIAARVMPDANASKDNAKSEQEPENQTLQNMYDLDVEQKSKNLFATGVGYLEDYKKSEITEQGLFERVAALAVHQQVQVVGAGIDAYQREINHQNFRIGVGLIAGVGDSVVGLAQGAESLGKAICDVAQFSKDIAENNPRANYTAEQAGHSFGKLVVGGIKVIEIADNYLGSLGAASFNGDNTKAFRDISALGQQLNQRWSEMNPEEKTRLTTRLTLDNLGPIAAAGAGAKLAKSMDIAGALQDLGASASVFGGKEREKYSRVIGQMVDCLTPQPVGLTTDGRLMPIPRDRLKNDGKMLMSKADDLEGKPFPPQGRNPELLNERDIVNPIDRNASVETKIAQLEALSKENSPLVESFLRQVDTKFGTKSEISFKTASDIGDKAKRPSIKDTKEWFDIEHIRDALRFRTPVDNLSELPKIVEALKTSVFEIVKPDLDKLIQPKGRGWRMAAFDLRAPNGQIVEYQIVAREMNEAGKMEHSMYKTLRGKNTREMTKAELENKNQADMVAIRLYRNAQEAYQKRTGQDLKSIERIVAAAREAISKGVE